MAKYDQNGVQVEVVEKLKAGQYLIRRFFTGRADEWEDEGFYTGDGLFIVDEVFSSPPTEKLDQKIKNLSKDINFLHGKKRELEQEIQGVEKAGKEKLAKYKKYDQLKNLDMFLDGKITHYVLEYHGSFKIISFENAVPDERYDKDRTKLLTLFGKSNGNLEWGLNKYSDGSGGNTTVTPCVSYEEALSVAQGVVDSKMDTEGYWCSELIREATVYGLKIDPEFIRKHKEKKQAQKNKQIEDLEKQVEKLRESA